MSDAVDTFASRLSQRFEGLISNHETSHGLSTLEIKPDHLHEVCIALRDEEEFSFEQLSDLCGVDYSTYGQADWETQDTSSTGFSRGVSEGAFREEDTKESLRFAVIYHLLSLKHNRRLRLRCYIEGEPPHVLNQLFQSGLRQTGMSVRRSICLASCSMAILICAGY